MRKEEMRIIGNEIIIEEIEEKSQLPQIDQHTSSPSFSEMQKILELQKIEKNLLELQKKSGDIRPLEKDIIAIHNNSLNPLVINAAWELHQKYFIFTFSQKNVTLTEKINDIYQAGHELRKNSNVEKACFYYAATLKLIDSLPLNEQSQLLIKQTQLRTLMQCIKLYLYKAQNEKNDSQKKIYLLRAKALAKKTLEDTQAKTVKGVKESIFLEVSPLSEEITKELQLLNNIKLEEPSLSFTNNNTPSVENPLFLNNPLPKLTSSLPQDPLSLIYAYTISRYISSMSYSAIKKVTGIDLLSLSSYVAFLTLPLSGLILKGAHKAANLPGVRLPIANENTTITGKLLTSTYFYLFSQIVYQHMTPSRLSWLITTLLNRETGGKLITTGSLLLSSQAPSLSGFLWEATHAGFNIVLLRQAALEIAKLAPHFQQLGASTVPNNPIELFGVANQIMNDPQNIAYHSLLFFSLYSAVNQITQGWFKTLLWLPIYAAPLLSPSLMSQLVTQSKNSIKTLSSWIDNSTLALPSTTQNSLMQKGIATGVLYLGTYLVTEAVVNLLQENLNYLGLDVIPAPLLQLGLRIVCYHTTAKNVSSVVTATPETTTLYLKELKREYNTWKLAYQSWRNPCKSYDTESDPALNYFYLGDFYQKEGNEVMAIEFYNKVPTPTTQHFTQTRNKLDANIRSNQDKVEKILEQKYQQKPFDEKKLNSLNLSLNQLRDAHEPWIAHVQKSRNVAREEAIKIIEQEGLKSLGIHNWEDLKKVFKTHPLLKQHANGILPRSLKLYIETQCRIATCQVKQARFLLSKAMQDPEQYLPHIEELLDEAQPILTAFNSNKSIATSWEITNALCQIMRQKNLEKQSEFLLTNYLANTPKTVTEKEENQQEKLLQKINGLQSTQKIYRELLLWPQDRKKFLLKLEEEIKQLENEKNTISESLPIYKMLQSILSQSDMLEPEQMLSTTIKILEQQIKECEQNFNKQQLNTITTTNLFADAVEELIDWIDNYFAVIEKRVEKIDPYLFATQAIDLLDREIKYFQTLADLCLAKLKDAIAEQKITAIEKISELYHQSIKLQDSLLLLKSNRLCRLEYSKENEEQSIQLSAKLACEQLILGEDTLISAFQQKKLFIPNVPHPEDLTGEQAKKWAMIFKNGGQHLHYNDIKIEKNETIACVLYALATQKMAQEYQQKFNCNIEEKLFSLPDNKEQATLFKDYYRSLCNVGLQLLAFGEKVSDPVKKHALYKKALASLEKVTAIGFVTASDQSTTLLCNMIKKQITTLKERIEKIEKQLGATDKETQKLVFIL